MKRLIAMLVAVAIVAAAIAVPAFAATKTVKVGPQMKFGPSSLSIKKGDTVKWSWSGSVPHNVTGPGFKSKTATKVTFSHKFAKAGTFRVVCTLHQALGQKMTIKVG